MYVSRMLHNIVLNMKHTSVFTLFAFLLPFLVSCTEQKSYIVYFGHHNGEKTHEQIEEHHHSFLFSLKESEEEAKTCLLYSYKNSINGFAAMLTRDEAFKLSELDEVVSVFPSKAQNLQTIRSWEFLGVRKSEERNVTIKNDLLEKAGYGKGIIVGLFDTGIWPESKSFSEEGMSPIPKKWKGICQYGDAWNKSHCNNKIIGARYYLTGFERHYGPINRTLTDKSSRDYMGHGTHTSSIVGGRIVHAEFEGFAKGTASGGAPLVHLAMYKVCWPLHDNDVCMDEDILAAFDDAISDGVDVLSLSLEGSEAWLHNGYTDNSIAIGSLHALKNNVVVSCAGGNQGPDASTVSNTAPWVITVAASSVDRAFVSPLLLGTGMSIPGESMTPYKLEEKLYPLVYAGEIEEANVTKISSGLCLSGSLSPTKTKGKIVFCLREKGTVITSISEVVKRAGGVGLISPIDPEYDEITEPDSHVLPDTVVGPINSQKILEYINSTINPTAYINHVGMALNVKPAPYMARFSSRGPNTITEDVLKPDITAPGTHILAAWPEAPPTLRTQALPTTKSKFKFLSGTSMACPHVSSVAALLKAIHPTWSSAAIRSAIMTTAAQTNNMDMSITDYSGSKADPFQFGSGHIHPTSAADPGLVYDASYTDYLIFLCNMYGKSVDKSFKCPPNPSSLNNLNYPSLAISELNGTLTVERVVTNVGESCKTYISQVEAPPGVSVKVSPSRLTFQRVGEKKRFIITIEKDRSGAKKRKDGYVFGWYSWSDGVHVVRSPMAINLA